MIRVGVAAVALSLASTACAPDTEAPTDAAGDPLITLPDSYKLEFENDYVKVVRVHYDVGARLPEHIHPAGMTAYIYLNDNEGVIFNHAGGGERPYTRPPVQAGGARFQTSSEEHHTLENISPTPSDFIRVLYKTDKVDLAGAIRRRIALSETEYSNKATRISRPVFEAGKPVAAPASDHPSLIVAWPSGRHYWVEPGATVSIPMETADPHGLVRLEFLTPPLPAKPKV